jgi:predicted phosphodiesterase
MAKIIKFVAAGDNHGHLGCPDTTEALATFVGKWKPSVRIHLGDLNDFGAWRKGASPDEQEEGIDEDLKAGNYFLRKVLRPTIYVQGNHDIRAEEMMHSRNGDRADNARRAVQSVADTLAEVGCREVHRYSVKGKKSEDVNRFRIGKLTGTHGFRVGVNATRETARTLGRPGDVVLHGHTHDFSLCTIEHLEQPIVGISGMCCMDIDKADYALRRLATTKWCNGWLHGVIDESTGDCKVWTAHRFQGRFIYSTAYELI